jgi:DedD protein
MFNRKTADATARLADPPAQGLGTQTDPADPAAQIRRKARRRLIGAAVLALTAVVVVPMILDTQPRPWTDDVAIQIPSKSSKFDPALTPAKPADKPADKNAAPATSSTAPVAAPQAVAPDSAKPAPVPVMPAPVAEPLAAVQAANMPPPPAKTAVTKPPAVEAAKPVEAPPPKQVEKPAAKPLEKAPEKPAAKPADKAPEKLVEKPVEKPVAKPVEKPAEKPAAKPAGKVLIQAGAFMTEEKIRALEQSLRKAGYSPYREEITTDKGLVTRVRFAVASTEAANAAIARLSLEGLSPKVVAQ